MAALAAMLQAVQAQLPAAQAAAARGEPLAGGASSQGGEVAAEPGLEPLGLEYGALAEALLRSPSQDGAAEVGVLKRLVRG